MDEQAVESYVKAGNIAIEVKKFVRGIVRPGKKLIDIALAVDEKIKELGGEWAFPVNLSIDEVAAHFTPTLNEEKVAEGLLKVDFGVCVDGYIADTATSFDLTKDNEHKGLIELNKKVLQNVAVNLKFSGQVKDVGKAVMEVVEEYNENNDKKISVIKGLSGHQLGQDIIHAGLTVSNYRNDNGTKLEDMAIAVEPFLTYGNGEIYEGGGGGIYVLKSEERPRDNEARKVLEYIKENFKTRPFCSRWLEQAGFKRLRYIFSILEKQGIIYHYPMLIEKTKRPVSQFENTFLFVDDGVKVTTEG